MLQLRDSLGDRCISRPAESIGVLLGADGPIDLDIIEFFVNFVGHVGGLPVW